MKHFLIYDFYFSSNFRENDFSILQVRKLEISFENSTISGIEKYKNMKLVQRKTKPYKNESAFCGIVPKSVLVRHYTDFSPEKLGEIYKNAFFEV